MNKISTTLLFSVFPITGIILHIWTIFYAFELGGFYYGFFTLLFPVIGEFVWMIKLWDIDEFYVYICFIHFIGPILLVMILGVPEMVANKIKFIVQKFSTFSIVLLICGLSIYILSQVVERLKDPVHEEKLSQIPDLENLSSENQNLIENLESEKYIPEGNNEIGNELTLPEETIIEPNIDYYEFREPYNHGNLNVLENESYTNAIQHINLPEDKYLLFMYLADGKIWNEKLKFYSSQRGIVFMPKPILCPQCTFQKQQEIQQNLENLNNFSFDFYSASVFSTYGVATGQRAQFLKVYEYLDKQ